MKKKIKWGKAGWGALAVCNTIFAILLAIDGNYEAMMGWIFTTLFIIAYRLQYNECAYWYRSSCRWMKLATAVSIKYTICRVDIKDNYQRQIKECQEVIAKLTKELEKVNGKENND